jgi:uncharacterized protein with HEPN domain
VDERDRQRVADIIDAADIVEQVVADGEEAFRSDRVRQLAIERLLEIIGEAARAMTEAGRATYPEVPWSDIVGLRTLLAHHYQRVDPAQVWVIATENVPQLLHVLKSDR